MTQYAFYINTDNCTGCKLCAVACFEKNDLEPGQKFRRVSMNCTGGWEVDAKGACVPKGVMGYAISMACNHCAKPACVDNCPTGAMHKEEETGVVKSTHSVCIGCGTCASACPYGVPFVDPALEYSRKCELCLEYVENGVEVPCVAACSMRAIEFGDLEELRAKHPEAVSQIDPMPSAADTEPSLLINPPSGYATGATVVSFNMPEDREALC